MKIWDNRVYTAGKLDGVLIRGGTGNREEEEYKLLMAIEGCVKDSSNCVAVEGGFCGMRDEEEGNMRCPF